MELSGFMQDWARPRVPRAHAMCLTSLRYVGQIPRALGTPGQFYQPADTRGHVRSLSPCHAGLTTTEVRSTSWLSMRAERAYGEIRT